MVHSNNAARIRLWLRLKGLDDLVDCKMITYPDLQSEEYQKINPLKKVPAFVTGQGDCVFESFVIMQYLEDKFGHIGMPLMPENAEERAFVNLLVRVHDIYIASPNCT
jgi:glutathione S-transferase